MNINILKILLMVILSMGFVANLWAKTGSGTCGNGCNWSYDSTTKTLVISGNGEMADYSSGDETPWYDYDSDTIIVSGISKIGAHAFEWSGVDNVEIGDSVIHIGSYAFNDNSLKNVTIPDSVEYIGDSAFHDNALDTVVLPDSVIVDGIVTFGDTGDSNAVVYCKGDLNLCEENLKDIYFDDGYITTVKDSSMCNGNYEWIEESCVRKNNNDKISCASGLVEWNNQCLAEYPFAKKRWTPAEANEWLHDGNNNFVIITFKK